MPLPSTPHLVIGRYALFEAIASGGMATVHYGRMSGPAGFARTVAIKRLHAHLAKEPEFVAMLVDEARLASRIRHPNVVSTLDIVTSDGEMLLVMDYVEGLTLAHLLRKVRGRAMPVEIAIAVVVGALDGLHAAHEARGENGEPLGIVHRDVSPQNIIVGADGVARVADFGIAKATGRLQTTRDGQIKGKSAYMAPEQIRGEAVDRRTDVYAAAVVLWEALTARRLFTGDSQAAVMNAVLEADVPRLSDVVPSVPAALDDVVFRGLSRDRDARFGSAREMAVGLERVVRPASSREVGDWVVATGQEELEKRARQLADVEISNGDESKIRQVVVADIGAARADVEAQTASSLASDPTPPRRRRRAFAVSVLVLGVLAVMGLVAGLRARGRVSMPGDAKGGPAALPAPTTPAPPPSVSTVDAVPSALPESTSVPDASATARAPSSASKPARPIPPMPARQPLNCSPPYDIDSKGTRHWKNGC